jgi:hypothetical protein
MPGNRSSNLELKELRPAVVQFDVVHARFIERDVERCRLADGDEGSAPPGLFCL